MTINISYTPVVCLSEEPMVYELHSEGRFTLFAPGKIDRCSAGVLRQLTPPPEINDGMVVEMVVSKARKAFNGGKLRGIQVSLGFSQSKLPKCRFKGKLPIHEDKLLTLDAASEDHVN